MSPTKKDSDSLSMITSVSACTPSVGYSRLSHRSASGFIAPSSAGHTYGTLSHDGNFSGISTFDDSNGMHMRVNHNRESSQPAYNTCHPSPPMVSAVSHTLPCVRSSSSPGDYLTHRYSSSSDSSETMQPSNHPQQGDPSVPLVEEEVPPPLPPKPHRSMSADGNGPLYMNCRTIPLPPRTRTSQETNTLL